MIMVMDDYSLFTASVSRLDNGIRVHGWMGEECSTLVIAALRYALPASLPHRTAGPNVHASGPHLPAVATLSYVTPSG